MRLELFPAVLHPRVKLWKTNKKTFPLLHNFPMNSMTTMELQKNANYYLGSLIRDCNLVRLQLLDGSCRTISNPKLGREFLAGQLEDGKALGLFRKSILRSAEFVLDSSLETSRMEYTRKAIGELLSATTFPTLARVRYLEPQANFQLVRFLGTARGFIFTDSQANPAIPIAGLGSLEIEL